MLQTFIVNASTDWNAENPSREMVKVQKTLWTLIFSRTLKKETKNLAMFCDMYIT